MRTANEPLSNCAKIMAVEKRQIFYDRIKEHKMSDSRFITRLFLDSCSDKREKVLAYTCNCNEPNKKRRLQ